MMVPDVTSNFSNVFFIMQPFDGMYSLAGTGALKYNS